MFESGAEHDPGVAVRVEAVENVLWLVLDVIPDRVDGAS